MDNETLMINFVMKSSFLPLTSSEISKLVYEKYKIKISKTIVKNYLWSFFRDVIVYDSVNYTYKLKNDRFLLDDLQVVFKDQPERPIGSSVLGGKIIITADSNILLQDVIKGIAILNYKIDIKKKNVDLIKQLNRVIEQLKDE
jgi:hypothetical protein